MTPGRWYSGGWMGRLDRGRMGRGSRVEGPAMVEFDESTCLITPGWGGKVDDAGTLVLGRTDG